MRKSESNSQNLSSLLEARHERARRRAERCAIVALLAVSMAASATARDGLSSRIVWNDAAPGTASWIPGEALQQTPIEQLPLSETCKRILRSLIQDPLPVEAVGSRPVGARAGGEQRGASLFDFLDAAPDVLLVRVARVEDGYRCGWNGVSRRVDVEVVSALKGSVAEGRSAFFVETGGSLELQGVRVKQALPEGLKPIQIGELLLLKALAQPGEVTQLLPWARFHVDGALILASEYPGLEIQEATPLAEISSRFSGKLR